MAPKTPKFAEFSPKLTLVRLLCEYKLECMTKFNFKNNENLGSAKALMRPYLCLITDPQRMFQLTQAKRKSVSNILMDVMDKGNLTQEFVKAQNRVAYLSIRSDVVYLRLSDRKT